MITAAAIVFTYGTNLHTLSLFKETMTIITIDDDVYYTFFFFFHHPFYYIIFFYYFLLLLHHLLSPFLWCDDTGRQLLGHPGDGFTEHDTNNYLD